ncbi:MAG: alkaline phosphatase D family protein [Xenococcaceae cyanobacterium MO_234.B1]|nr:alkaline phosphatase D family protein [Xenococcaceae cyanobacterium MO_234.B1]
MNNLSKLGRFNRRVFCAACIFVLSLSKKQSAHELKTIKANWCWLGALTSSGVTIKAKLNIEPNEEKNYIQVIYSTTPNLSSPKRFKANSLDKQIATFNLNNLQEDTQYYCVITVDGRRYPEKGTLKFKTVKVNQPYNFAIGCSSCAGGTVSGFLNNGVSNSSIFDIIREYNTPPLTLFIHMGDLHYKDIKVQDFQDKDINRYRKAYDDVLSQDSQRKLYQNIPIAYIWDDHDYSSNNSDGNYPGKWSASAAYREQVPHYPLVEAVDKIKGTGGIYQSFVIGRVRFIMTDNRFHRDSVDKEDNPEKTLLGKTQKEWFFQELLEGNNNQGLIVWVNSVPWIAGNNPETETTEAWDRYAIEREEIANFLQKNHIAQKLIMISGDAHMLALDDGSNNIYASEGVASFPVIQAASLDSIGSIKGGDYSEKPIKGRKQWGVLHFTDDGQKIEVKVELKKKNETKIEAIFTF